MRWKGYERLLATAESVGVVVLLAYFFYRNIFAVIPLSIVGFLFFKGLVNRKIRKTQDELETQFKECILSVGTALKAGYAVENAFRESMSDMKKMYGEKAYIVTELELINRGLVLNMTLEELLCSLANRSGNTNIEQFSEVFTIAKRSGGNMPEIIRTTSVAISRQIDSRKEIATLLSGRQMEQNIMKIMPFAIVIYVGITSRGYFDSLYGNMTGVLIMTGCLGIYMLAYFLGDKILSKLESEM